MALNSSSFNDSPFYPNPLWDMECFFMRPGSLIFTSFYITITLLILPICIFALYLGFQRCRQQSSTSSTTSHSDVFTFHKVVMELVDYIGSTLRIYGIYTVNEKVFIGGFYLYSLAWYGRILFHFLTCVERYLAVVHPVTYLNLKGQRGVRIRNICIGCVWLFCFAAITLMSIKKYILFLDLGLMIFSLMGVAFCSLSVLRELIRPGPGEQGGDRKRVDQSKRRAFYTIMAILGVLLLMLSGNMTWVALYVSRQSKCELTTSEAWLNIPSSLVLPLLFLHKAGKL